MSDDIVIAPPPPRPSRRVVTREKAQALADLLRTDPTHNVESAAVAVGLKGSTVREMLRRYSKDECATPEDEEIAEIIDDARAEHIHTLRKLGFVQAGDKNMPGVTYVKWQLEIQDPLGHPRKTETAVELSAPGGGPLQVDNTIRYVVMVPPPEPDDEPEE